MSISSGPTDASSPVADLPIGVRGAVLARSFLVQASWNYRTMLGTGMAFALTPVLRHVHRDGAAFERAVSRHASLFNAHPYLASFALGALARMEAEGESDERIERFRAALRGPLGAIGDRLVWAGWLPLCALFGISLMASTSPVIGILAFLVLYNAGHVALRAWGFEVGWSAGRDLGRRLAQIGLAREARRVEAALCLFAGLVAGIVLAAPGPSAAWTLAGIAALLAGYAFGPRAWRPAAWIVTLGMAALVVASHLLPA